MNAFLSVTKAGERLALAPATARICFAALLCVVAYQLAALTWLAFPQQQSASAWQPNIRASQSSSRGIDLAPLLSANLFGKYVSPELANQQKPVEEAPSSADAPKTQLRVKLAGLVASSDPSRSIAIIEHRNKQQTYALEEEIDGTKATVVEIYADRVILDNQGKLESLLLDPDGKSSSRGAASRPQRTTRPAAQSTASNTGSSAAEVREALRDPSKITDFVRINPHREDGQLRGYRVNPGKSPQIFNEFGLRPNDLAVAINGYDLTDNAQAMQIMQELSQLTEVSLTVEREGQLEELYLSLPE